jgi:hypothetical protein
MHPRVDLHTHTTASDGELAPAALLALQLAEGTTLTAITDHDTLAGFDAAVASGAPAGLRLLSGIELSARHGGLEVHVVGLGFGAADVALRAAVDAQSRRREARARAIAARLESLGHPGAWAEALRHAGGGVVGRPHFARFLVESGRVRDAEEAFRRYLGEGRPAWCGVEWPVLEEAVAWIRAAGGTAVLAHPLAYELGRGKLRALLAEFRDCGGTAAEVALAGIAPGDMHNLARLVRDLGLRASAGSDYHAAAQFWRRPSRIPPLPEYLEPVWAEWS